MSLLERAAPTISDLAGLKARQRGVWSAGDDALIGSTLQIVGGSLCEALDLPAFAMKQRLCCTVNAVRSQIRNTFHADPAGSPDQQTCGSALIEVKNL